MPELKPGTKIAAGLKLPAGAHVNLSAAGKVMVRPSADEVKAGANPKEGVHKGSLRAGEEVVIVSIESPERLAAAFERGDLEIVSGG